jgi:hypothetical protein
MYGSVKESEAQSDSRREAARGRLVLALHGPHVEEAAAAIAWAVAPPEGAVREPCGDADVFARGATSAMVERLGTPGARESALRVLSSGKADAAAAGPALRAVLGDDDALPWAVIGLTRMGEDVSAETPKLAAVLDGATLTNADPSVTVAAERSLDALRVLGPRAAGALGPLESLAARLDPNCQRPVPLHALTTAIASVGAADPPRAASALAALRRCRYVVEDVTDALTKLGPAGAATLTAWFRGDELRACDRVHVASALEGKGFALSAQDQALARRLSNAHCPRHMLGQPVLPPREPPRSAPAVAIDALAVCRAEAGVSPPSGEDLAAELRFAAPDEAPPGFAAAGAFGACLHDYACGPSRRSYATTLRRCCSAAFGAHPPPACRIVGTRRRAWWRRLLPGGHR